MVHPPYSPRMRVRFYEKPKSHKTIFWCIIMLVTDDTTGAIRRADDVDFADRVLELKNKGEQWEAIEELVKHWSQDCPEEFNGFKVHVKNMRDTQIDPEFGQTKSKEQERRMTLVFPLKLQAMIRAVYPVEELEMGSEFFEEFARRFKMFQIPDKL
jgi:hypothetical protein